MKSSHLLLLSFVFLSFTLSAPEGSVPDIEKDLVAYYSFNQCDARDESGNESHGRMYGGVSCWCGVQGEGLLLDGQTDYIEFGGRVNAAFGTTDFTISFYFKSSGHSVFEQSLFSKRELPDSVRMMDLRLNRERKLLITEVYEHTWKYYSGLSPEAATDTWVHYALVRKGTWAYTYINGILQNTSRKCSGVDISNEALLSFSNSPLIQIGKARRFKGILDELRVYERALTGEEIYNLYLKNPVEEANDDCLT
ncbi:MAG TPA: LamG domain-containing protein [Phaeodactylibacter sp.]|nr:LamG domain-containing protein [Phaeodactylibacter sp.]